MVVVVVVVGGVFVKLSWGCVRTPRTTHLRSFLLICMYLVPYSHNLALRNIKVRADEQTLPWPSYRRQWAGIYPYILYIHRNPYKRKKRLLGQHSRFGHNLLGISVKYVCLCTA